MRLAHFIQRYPPAVGGSEAYFARLSRYCAAAGDAVTVFTTDALALDAFWSPNAACTPSGVKVEAGIEVRRYPLWRMRGRRWLLKPLSLFPHRLWQCLTMPCNPVAWDMWHDANHESSLFDAVHASAFPYAWPIVCAWRLARRLGVPFLVTPFLHLGNPDDRADRTRRGYTSPALTWLLRQADAVFVQTPSELAAARQLGIPADRLVLQGLGVDPHDCTGGKPWRLFPSPGTPGEGEGKPIVIGHLANLSFEKGTCDLIEALEPLWQERRPIHLLLAGPQMPNFTRFWDAFTRRRPEFARDRVTCLGALSDEVKRDFFASLDLFALPSRSDSFGLVLLEAWANGVPSVAYRAGGIAEVIQHERDGLLVPCGNIPALTQSIGRLCADGELRQRFGQHGQGRLPSEFVWADKLALVRSAYHPASAWRIVDPQLESTNRVHQSP